MLNEARQVDLPQPDSPTIPRISPRCTSKDTPSTAFTWAWTVCRRPPHREVFAQCPDRQKCVTLSHIRVLYNRTSMASRRPSLSRLKAIEVKKIITPGRTGTQVFT